MASPRLKRSTNDTLHNASHVKTPLSVPKADWLQMQEDPTLSISFCKKKKKGTVAEMPVFVTALTMIIQMMKILQYEFISL